MRCGLQQWLAAVALFSGLGIAMHTQSASAQGASAIEKPFVEHRIALQLSDNDPKKQGLIISVAFKLLEVYGPDTIDIEVVTFGPGIDLLKEDSPDRQLVDSLVAHGVKFDVCGNTLDTIERETGKRPKINPHAIEVDAGVPYLLSLAEKKYTIIRP
jgi:intracellular sulfur oxidation DsrE/DsrF family protein